MTVKQIKSHKATQYVLTVGLVICALGAAYMPEDRTLLPFLSLGLNLLWVWEP